MSDPEYITVKEAAERLGVSRVWVRQLLEQEAITLYRRGSSLRPYLLKAADVETLKAKRETITPIAT